MFATTVFFYKCGIGLQFSSIEPKWFVVKRQESTDGALGSDIYVLNAEIGTERQVNRMRLIDADRLMYSLRGNVLIDVVPELEETILQQPTAFDKEKVIESIKIVTAGDVLNYNYPSEYVQGCVDMSKEIIKIIEKGGIE